MSHAKHMDYLLAHLPDFSSWSETQFIIYIIAALGVVLHIYGVFLETARRQDLVFWIAGGCLFVYATYMQEKLFAIAMFGFAAASMIKFIEIMMGKYHQDPAIKDPKGKIYKV